MDVRVDSRIPIEIKKKAAKKLEAHGLSISSFIRMTLSSVAKDGLPNYWVIPNSKIMASIDEAIDDIRNPHLKSASSYKELKDLLNE